MSKTWVIPEHEKDLEALWASFGRIPNNKQDNTQYTERGYNQDYLDEHWELLDE